MICIFARKVTDELASLVEQIDVVVERNAARKMAAFVVLFGDDPEVTKLKLESLARDHRIERVPLTVFSGAAGPPNYAIAKDAEVTVMMWGGEKKLVRVNHTHGKGKVGKSFIAKVVADASAADVENSAVAAGVFNTQISIERLKQLGTLTDIDALDLQDVNLTPTGLKYLQGLTKLRLLNLFRNKKLTDSAVDTLIAFTQLEELNISSTQITNTGLERLAKNLPKLKKLNFRNSRQIDDTGLEQLLQRPELEVLLCGNTLITDAGLARISKMTSLRELEVRKTKITDAGFFHLKQLTKLRKLNCSDNNKITSESVRHLSNLTELRALDLSQTRIGDAGLAQLGGLIHLEQLDLSRTPITGEGLRHLHQLRHLHFVNLFGTRVTDETVIDLQKALPNCEIVR